MQQKGDLRQCLERQYEWDHQLIHLATTTQATPALMGELEISTHGDLQPVQKPILIIITENMIMDNQLPRHRMGLLQTT